MCGLAEGTYEVLESVPTEAESGWDTLREVLLLRNSDAGYDESRAFEGFTGLARGAQVSGKNMWYVSRTAKLLAFGLFRCEVTSQGLITARGYKVTYDAAAASQSAKNVTVDSVLYASVATREGGVTATFEYVLVGSPVPTNADFLTKWTGRVKTLPSGWEPTVPATIWSYLTVFTLNYPNGWIFEGATMENIPGVATVYLVKEKYVHQMEKTPGG